MEEGSDLAVRFFFRGLPVKEVVIEEERKSPLNYVHVFHPNPLRFPRATPRRTGCANKGVATGRRDLNLCTFIFCFFTKTYQMDFRLLLFPQESSWIRIPH
jgi:hypothetical protein